MSDDEARRNLAAQRHRTDAASARLTDASERADALRARARALGVEPSEPQNPRPARTPADAAQPVDWDGMTAANTSWLEAAGLADVALDQLLEPGQLDELERLDDGRERWSASDFVTVGGCAAIGVLATAYDQQVDQVVKTGLARLGRTELLRQFEADGKRLAIDHTGPDFGGPGHRARSAGHDIGRPFEALSQIRNGEFRGAYWEHGQQFVTIDDHYTGHSQPEALVLWLKHLGADIVTTTSLPLPWWSKLYEMPNRDMRKLAHDLYNPYGQTGLNIRTVLMSKTLPVITSELIVGTKVHLDGYSRAGEIRRLSERTRTRRSEMLLAAHAATGVASLGKTAATAGYEGPLALRHLNAPALARTGYLGLKVARAHRQRVGEHVPTWGELLRDIDVPWELDELKTMRAADVGQPGLA